MRRAICTSAARRTSTRIYSGVVLSWTSSLSFGSHSTCSGSHPFPINRRAAIVDPQRAGHDRRRVRLRFFLSLIVGARGSRAQPRIHENGRCVWKHRAARAHCRLLGPCYKTGEKLPAPEILARTRSTHDVLSRAGKESAPLPPLGALSATNSRTCRARSLHTSISPSSYRMHRALTPFWVRPPHAREKR